MTDSIQATVLTQELAAPSPTVLDIYVVWHSKDKCGRNVFDRLISHYHSEHFSGLAGSAIEVLSRSHPRTTGCDAPAPIPTRCGTVDTTADDVQARYQDSASGTASPFTVIIPVIGRHMIKASEDQHSAWSRYLKSLDTLRESASSAATPSVLIFPIIGAKGLDTSAPFVKPLANCQGPVIGEEAYAAGEVTRGVGQAIIQNLLWRQARMESISSNTRLRIFVSHAQADIPETDRTGRTATGVTTRVLSQIHRTHLLPFSTCSTYRLARSGTRPYASTPGRTRSLWCARITTPAASGHSGKCTRQSALECLSCVSPRSAPENRADHSSLITYRQSHVHRSPRGGYHQKGCKRRIPSTRPLSLL